MLRFQLLTIMLAVATHPAWASGAVMGHLASPAHSASVPPALSRDRLFTPLVDDFKLLVNDREWSFAPVAVAANGGAQADTAGILAISSGLGNAADLKDIAEFATAARHRRMAKFLFVILLLGGLIRYLTSSSYLQFIREVLDPRANWL